MAVKWDLIREEAINVKRMECVEQWNVEEDVKSIIDWDELGFDNANIVASSRRRERQRKMCRETFAHLTKDTVEVT